MTRRVKLVVTVKTIRDPILRKRQVPRTHFGLQYWRTIEARIDPKVWPRYTILPRKPN